MTARSLLVPLLALASTACGEARINPCAEALGRLDDAVMARMQGLTAADDIPRQAQWMSEADACRDTSGRPRVEAHARALAARLSAAGAHAELLSLSRLLAALPVSAELRDDARAGTTWAESATRSHGAGDGPLDARLRARVMMAGPADVLMPPAPTSAAVTRWSADDAGFSCAVVVPGTDAPTGGVQVRILRGGRALTLFDTIPVATWTRDRALPMTACIRGPILDGDELVVTGAAESRALALSPDAVARVAGALRARLLGRDVMRPPECTQDADAAIARACTLGWPAP